MIRKREALGIALLFFGIGLVLAVLLQSGFCTLLLGAAAIVAGCLLIHCR